MSSRSNSSRPSSRLRTKTADLSDFLRRRDNVPPLPPPLPNSIPSATDSPESPVGTKLKRRIPLFGLKKRSGTLKEHNPSDPGALAPYSNETSTPSTSAPSTQSTTLPPLTISPPSLSPLPHFRSSHISTPDTPSSPISTPIKSRFVSKFHSPLQSSSNSIQSSFKPAFSPFAVAALSVPGSRPSTNEKPRNSISSTCSGSQKPCITVSLASAHRNGDDDQKMYVSPRAVPLLSGEPAKSSLEQVNDGSVDRRSTSTDRYSEAATKSGATSPASPSPPTTPKIFFPVPPLNKSTSKSGSATPVSIPSKTKDTMGSDSPSSGNRLVKRSEAKAADIKQGRLRGHTASQDGDLEAVLEFTVPREFAPSQFAPSQYASRSTAHAASAAVQDRRQGSKLVTHSGLPTMSHRGHSLASTESNNPASRRGSTASQKQHNGSPLNASTSTTQPSLSLVTSGSRPTRLTAKSGKASPPISPTSSASVSSGLLPTRTSPSSASASRSKSIAAIAPASAPPQGPLPATPPNSASPLIVKSSPSGLRSLRSTSTSTSSSSSRTHASSAIPSVPSAPSLATGSSRSRATSAATSVSSRTLVSLPSSSGSVSGSESSTSSNRNSVAVSSLPTIPSLASLPLPARDRQDDSNATDRARSSTTSGIPTAKNGSPVPSKSVVPPSPLASEVTLARDPSPPPSPRLQAALAHAAELEAHNSALLARVDVLERAARRRERELRGLRWLVVHGVSASGTSGDEGLSPVMWEEDGSPPSSHVSITTSPDVSELALGSVTKRLQRAYTLPGPNSGSPRLAELYEASSNPRSKTNNTGLGIDLTESVSVPTDVMKSLERITKDCRRTESKAKDMVHEAESDKDRESTRRREKEERRASRALKRISTSSVSTSTSLSSKLSPAPVAYSQNLQRGRTPSIAQVIESDREKEKLKAREREVGMEEILEKLRAFGGPRTAARRRESEVAQEISLSEPPLPVPIPN